MYGRSALCRGMPTHSCSRVCTRICSGSLPWSTAAAHQVHNLEVHPGGHCVTWRQDTGASGCCLTRQRVRRAQGDHQPAGGLHRAAQPPGGLPEADPSRWGPPPPLGLQVWCHPPVRIHRAWARTSRLRSWACLHAMCRCGCGRASVAVQRQAGACPRGRLCRDARGPLDAEPQPLTSNPGPVQE